MPGGGELVDVELEALAERGPTLALLREHQPATPHALHQMAVGDDEVRHAAGMRMAHDEGGAGAFAAVVEHGVDPDGGKQQPLGGGIDVHVEAARSVMRRGLVQPLDGGNRRPLRFGGFGLVAHHGQPPEGAERPHIDKGDLGRLLRLVGGVDDITRGLDFEDEHALARQDHRALAKLAVDEGGVVGGDGADDFVPRHFAAQPRLLAGPELLQDHAAGSQHLALVAVVQLHRAERALDHLLAHAHVGFFQRRIRQAVHRHARPHLHPKTGIAGHGQEALRRSGQIGRQLRLQGVDEDESAQGDFHAWRAFSG